ncbi:MAG: ATP-binding protein [Alphaproteobacteria bacterium]
MAPVESLRPEALYRTCDPKQFKFKTTAEIEALEDTLGQDRAVDAVRFGIGMRRRGYNLFVLGPTGVGKHALARQFLDRRAASEPVPPDWCYVNNFKEASKPRVLKLPPGKAVTLRADMKHLVDELRVTIPAAFEGEDYRSRKQIIVQQFKERHEQAFGEVQKRAREKNIALIRTPAGIALGPMRKGEVLSAEEFDKLPAGEQERLKKDMDELQQELQETLHRVPKWDKEQREKVRELNREVTRFAVGHLIDELRGGYGDLPNVLEYLRGVEEDVTEHAEDFIIAATGGESPLAGLLPAPTETPFFSRYEVNVLVDNGSLEGAPVVYEDHPTHPNLIGRIEHIAQLGALVTDFSLIKAGALHRANGGYLILDARKLVFQPYAYEELKRALRSGEIRIESLAQILSLVSTVSLEAEPIPLDIKIVLIGERLLYYLLSAYDPEFDEFFKVAVDFEEDMALSAETVPLYARLIATLAHKEDLMPFDRSAVARVIEQSARLSEDAEKLSARVQSITDLLREADYWAQTHGRDTVAAEDVQDAIDAQLRRASRVRERIQEEIKRGTILIDTAGAAPGQVNGLSLLQLGGFSFGRPSRITARVRLGQGRVIDIEREVKLGGPIHSKGVLILSGYLGARYAPERPLSLSASLVFEQSYGGVEGDSASLAELCALLSAVAQVPVRQSLAITGSVNQNGQAQAIGGVNDKVEGFFDVCRNAGLNGEQGVIIPAANVKHLMLRREVVDAVKAGKFHIYAVETVDEAIELLTGLTPGERDKRGRYPKRSFNQLVEARIIGFAAKARRFGARPTAQGRKEKPGAGEESEEGAKGARKASRTNDRAR